MEEPDRPHPERADKPTLLIVDDDDGILRVLTRFARTAGFEAIRLCLTAGLG
jgi:ActR/RegA family two-component response regulator